MRYLAFLFQYEVKMQCGLLSMHWPHFKCSLATCMGQHSSWGLDEVAVRFGC